MNCIITDSKLIDEFNETIAQLHTALAEAVRKNVPDLVAGYKEQLDEVERTKQKLMDDPELLGVIATMFLVICKRNNKSQESSK